MDTFTTSSLALLALFWWFGGTISRAENGYEDIKGFHFGDRRNGRGDNRARPPARRVDSAAAEDSRSSDRTAP